MGEGGVGVGWRDALKVELGVRLLEQGLLGLETVDDLAPLRVERPEQRLLLVKLPVPVAARVWRECQSHVESEVATPRAATGLQLGPG